MCNPNNSHRTRTPNRAFENRKVCQYWNDLQHSLVIFRIKYTFYSLNHFKCYSLYLKCLIASYTLFYNTAAILNIVEATCVVPTWSLQILPRVMNDKNREVPQTIFTDYTHCFHVDIYMHDIIYSVQNTFFHV